MFLEVHTLCCPEVITHSHLNQKDTAKGGLPTGSHLHQAICETGSHEPARRGKCSGNRTRWCTLGKRLCLQVHRAPGDTAPGWVLPRNSSSCCHLGYIFSWACSYLKFSAAGVAWCADLGRTSGCFSADWFVDLPQPQTCSRAVLC